MEKKATDQQVQEGVIDVQISGKGVVDFRKLLFIAGRRLQIEARLHGVNRFQSQASISHWDGRQWHRVYELDYEAIPFDFRRLNDANADPVEEHEFMELSEKLLGLALQILAPDFTITDFLSRDGQVYGLSDDEKKAMGETPYACRIVLKSGRSHLVQGPFTQMGEYLHCATPSEEETWLMTPLRDIAEIAYSE